MSNRTPYIVWFMILLICAAPGASAVAFSVQRFLVNNDQTSVYAVNSAGAVVGNAPGAGFLWNGQMQSLGQVQPTGINDTGEVVGMGGPSGAFVWDGAMHQLSVWETSYSSIRPYGLNDAGEVVGALYYNNPSGSKAVIWNQGYSERASFLPSLTEGSQGAAWAINDSGQVVGDSTDGGGTMRPVIWEAGAIRDLGILNGKTGGSARAISSRGYVAGTCYSATGSENRAFFYNGVMHDLGVLSGRTVSNALGVNDLGWVVGYSRTAQGNQRAFLWDGSTMLDLTDLIQASGYDLWEATDINNAGQITCNGYYNGQWQGFLLTPVPEPSSLLGLLCGVGGMSCLSRKRRR